MNSPELNSGLKIRKTHQKAQNICPKPKALHKCFGLFGKQAEFTFSTG